MPVRTRPPLGLPLSSSNPIVSGGAGSSDSTGNIQQAIDQAYAQGRPVYIPAGEYTTYEKLKLYTGVRIYGDGYNSVIRASVDYDTHDADTDADLTPMIEVYHATSPAAIHHSTEVSHLRFIGLAGESNADELYGWHGMFETYGNKVSDCFFEDFGSGAGAIDPSNSYKNIFTRNVLTNCGVGFGLTGSDFQFGNEMTANQLFDCRTAFALNFPYDTLISDNHVYESLIGLNCDGSYQSRGGIQILGNVFHVADPGNNTAVALYLGTGNAGIGYCTGMTIANNQFSCTGGPTDLITFHLCHRSKFINNTLRAGTSLVGLSFRGASTDVFVEGNHIFDSEYGIGLLDAAQNRIRIKGNFLYSVNTNSILIQGTATNTYLRDNDISQSAAISDSGVGTINESLQVTAAGTAYSLTNSAATLDFGTTDPTVTLPIAGRYKLEAQVQLDYAGATVVAETATIKLRRTNNTAADVTGATLTLDLPVSTTLTNTYGIFRLPPVYYTATAGDIIALQGQVSATLGAGTINAVAAGIIATPCF
jgi:hypothetical protein